ncbi:transcriptional regulator [Clostridioides difficile]|nr:transcriptional regulator [Clostridioides difficile]
MINENLKSLRKINQYTQEELAEKLNVSRQSIAKWESGVSQTKGYY